MLRNEFIEKIKQISKENLVFIDESGIEDNACREYGWSIKVLDVMAIKLININPGSV
ncbi:transposase [Orientia tsutsugamushi str. Gilliam]|uniref:Transposase n=1 Tax=Orientia tsutsugamushi str. Gilliam TaxID=1359184 RepID=A0A0F3MDA5_ORITS|nr:transposase [Orientia tsutsugamushi str. Gilliam]